MKEIRFGLVGCGVIGRVHAEALAELDGARLAGVTDARRESADAFAAAYGAVSYPSLEDLLASDAIDAVCICTPSGLHAEEALAALRAGKHVILEKPMALCSADAERLVAASKESRHILSVISQHRFRPDVVRLKELMDAGAFGKLILCDLYMKFWRDPTYFTSNPWRGTREMDGGGALMNQGIHGVDLIRFLAGDLKLLRGRVKTQFHSIEVEDTAAALLEFDCGALGVIEATTAAYPGDSRRIEIRGTEGYAALADSVLEKLCVHGEVLIDRTVTADAGTASDPTRMNHMGHLLQLRNILGAIRGEEALKVTPEDGAAAIRLIEEIYRSSEE